MDVLQRWHEIVRSRNPALLADLLARDAVFHSPVMFTPAQGRDEVALYLTGAMHVIANPSFRYVRQISDDRNAVLEFETEIDGTHVNGVDLLAWDGNGQITDVKVMLRPRRALDVVADKMRQLLEELHQAPTSE